MDMGGGGRGGFTTGFGLGRQRGVVKGGGGGVCFQ